MHHRRVDAFTDSHSAVAAFRRVLVPEHGHYARVISDVFLDHFLGCRFEEYAGEPLESFLARTYATIDPHVDALPGTLRDIYPRMRDEQWLQSYRHIDGVRLALAGISRRFTRKPQLETATRHLTDSREQLECQFDIFFPEVMRFVTSSRA